MEINVEVVSPGSARKKKRNPAEWKTNKQKHLRYSAKHLPVFPKCGHRGTSFNCSLLTMNDVKNFHESFYSVKTKSSQDAFILKYCSCAPPARHHPKTGDRGIVEEKIERELKINFMHRSNNGKTLHWPSSADVQSVVIENILCTIKTPPHPISSRQFALGDTELKKIERIFDENKL
ncbi:hypothetical protein LSTR_LSTR001656 [Laodelphax striatellus]|uniref:Uncharacterized protein n=1 Tax=Laodelphax striatellus TaxID=195883 RepID=A0A482XBQ2_LAOST|nr:hypothetical protein LSTR_LSTR001656 [Laodelphax striatellus]